MSSLCRLFGYSRQGYWKRRRSVCRDALDECAVVGEVRRLRERMPMAGVRKLQVKLRELGHPVGRDRLFRILRGSGLLVSGCRHRVVTTDSRHWMRKWPNLVSGLEITGMNQVWVSDITYVELQGGGGRSWLYLSLVTDSYTHEIVGWALHPTLDTGGPLRALEMALSRFPPGSLAGLIHHSDRGAQYCCAEYVGRLRENGILVSMTDGGDPYQNAVAERVNGILKKEWLYGMRLSSEDEARAELERIIAIYNNERPHMSIGMLTPARARATNATAVRMWGKKKHGQDKPRTAPNG